jgi:hypothetical protein
MVFCLSAAGALAQEFTTTPRVPPQTTPPGPSINEGSNSSILHKLFTTQRKYQLINPGAPASYGSGSQIVLANPMDAIQNRRERPNVWKLFSFNF